MLDNDIIRDTLLCIEKACEPHTDDNGRFIAKAKLHWEAIYEDEYLCSKYLIDDIKYCIIKLKEATMIEATICGRPDKISFLDIDDITWSGHEFLNSIRDDAVWNQIKSKAGTLAKTSIAVVAEIAKEIVTLALKSKLGIGG